MEDKPVLNHKFLSFYEGKPKYCFLKLLSLIALWLLMVVYHEVELVNVKIKLPLYLLLTLFKWFT